MWLGGATVAMSLLLAGVVTLLIWLARSTAATPAQKLAVASVGLVVVAGLLTTVWGAPGPPAWLPEQPASGEMASAMTPLSGVPNYVYPPWIPRPLPGGQILRLRAEDFAFRPSVITAPAGIPLTLELINSGAVVHIVVIPVLGVRAALSPGERRTIGVGSVAAGTYEFFCAIPAHRDAGMIGRLVVGPEN